MSANRNRPGGTICLQPLLIALWAMTSFIQFDASAMTDRVYWSDTYIGRIERAQLDGANRETIFTTGQPVAVAVDAVNGYLYFSELDPPRIRRSKLDGSNVQTLIDADLVDPQDIELDVADSQIYWVEPRGGRVMRANFDGSQLETLYGFGAIAPTGLALDLNNRQLYFTAASHHAIYRAPIDGGGDVEVVIDTDLYEPYDIEIDRNTNRIVWTEPDPSRIQSAELDGSDIRLVFIANAIAPAGLAIDEGRGIVYFTDIRTLRIIRIDYDMTLFETIVSNDIIAPARIDLELDNPIEDCLALDVENLVAGKRATITITRGTPDARAVTVYGLRTGETIVNGTFGYCATFGIDGVTAKRVIGGPARTFDTNGEITFDRFIPFRAKGTRVYFQSAQQGTCPDECMSNLVEETIQ